MRRWFKLAMALNRRKESAGSGSPLYRPDAEDYVFAKSFLNSRVDSDSPSSVRTADFATNCSDPLGRRSSVPHQAALRSQVLAFV
jgi:hypothetical protein